MTATGVMFLAFSLAAVAVLPRRWASLPLIVGVCYMTRAQAIEVGPFTFAVYRILIAVSVARVLLRRERLAGGVTVTDALMLLWGGWMIASVIFHRNPEEQVVLRLGLVFDGWGLYALFRVFCGSARDLESVSRIVAGALVPIALLMLVERMTAQNVFAVLGGVSAAPSMRLGIVRAQGPFSHSILAGNVGAVCLPFLLALWPRYRASSVLGSAACLLMIYACGSTGPIVSCLVGLGALTFWVLRAHMRLVRWSAILAIAVLAAIMKAPVYYVIARVDLTGGSTGWHRSRLIQAAFSHLSEWWLAGTDYTRHWMASGVPWSPDHADITNHYLRMGVLGGMPLLLLFVALLISGFGRVGRGVHPQASSRGAGQFLLWGFGASLCAHAASCLGVSYFDQSILFLYLTLAGVNAPVTDRCTAVVGREPVARRVGWRYPALPKWTPAAGKYSSAVGTGAQVSRCAPTGAE